MKPIRIRILIIEANDRDQRELADYLSADTLLDIVGCHRTGEAWKETGTDADIAILGLSDCDADNRKNLWLLRQAGIPVIAVTPSNADAEQYRGLVSYILYIPAEDALLRTSELYPRLKYQIRNVRLAGAVEKGGFKGTWRMFPTYRPKPYIVPQPGIFRRTDIRLIAIGASAGGTQALMEIIPALPPDMPAIALVQHMPEAFVEMFASHLQEKSNMRVCLAVGGERVEQGTLYLTALDRHLTIVSRAGGLYIACAEGTDDDSIRPSVDQLFFSAAALGRETIGVILTGMGTDGARGLLEMRKAGAYTIGQDEKTCVVYGMPLAAYKLGAVASQLPLDQIPAALQKRVFPGEGGRSNAQS